MRYNKQILAEQVLKIVIFTSGFKLRFTKLNVCEYLWNNVRLWGFIKEINTFLEKMTQAEEVKMLSMIYKMLGSLERNSNNL